MSVYVCHSIDHPFPIYIVQTERDLQGLKYGLIKSNDGHESKFGDIVYERDCKIKNLS